MRGGGLGLAFVPAPARLGTAWASGGGERAGTERGVVRADLLRPDHAHPRRLWAWSSMTQTQSSPYTAERQSARRPGRGVASYGPAPAPPNHTERLVQAAERWRGRVPL